MGASQKRILWSYPAVARITALDIGGEVLVLLLGVLLVLVVVLCCRPPRALRCAMCDVGGGSRACLEQALIWI